jgi:hypothetical protein
MPVLPAEQEKRELRLRIGRMRRRIDRRVRGVEKRGREMLSWRKYVVRYPGWSALAAFGGGLALSAGLRRLSLPRRLGWRLAREAISQIIGRVGLEVKRWWKAEASSVFLQTETQDPIPKTL